MSHYNSSDSISIDRSLPTKHTLANFAHVEGFGCDAIHYNSYTPDSAKRGPIFHELSAH